AFAVFPDTKYYETSPEKRLLPDPKSRIEEWALPEQLQTAIAGLQAEDIRLVTVISELVNDAVRFSQSDISRVGPHDTSYVWRPAIEDHPQNRDTGLLNNLVVALRGASERLVKSRPDQLNELLGALSAYPWFIFTRIILHILRVHKDVSYSTLGRYL